jgi:hypothetical protein
VVSFQLKHESVSDRILGCFLRGDEFPVLEIGEICGFGAVGGRPMPLAAAAPAKNNLCLGPGWRIANGLPAVLPVFSLSAVRHCRILVAMTAGIAYTSVYERRVGKILRAEERQAMEVHIATTPENHPVVAGTAGVRKARWGRQGKGKRGGVRVIYFYRSVADVVYFLDIYAKSEKEDLTSVDKRQLKGLVNRLRGVQ